MVTRRNRKNGGGMFNWFKSSSKPSRPYPGSGYNNNYKPSFSPPNNQTWRNNVSTTNPSRPYPSSGYNNNYKPNFPPPNNQTWRVPKKEVSEYKSLFNRIASGKTRKNAFGRGPNAQIKNRIRNANIQGRLNTYRATKTHR